MPDFSASAKKCHCNTGLRIKSPFSFLIRNFLFEVKLSDTNRVVNDVLNFIHSWQPSDFVNYLYCCGIFYLNRKLYRIDMHTYLLMGYFINIFQILFRILIGFVACSNTLTIRIEKKKLNTNAAIFIIICVCECIFDIKQFVPMPYIHVWYIVKCDVQFSRHCSFCHFLSHLFFVFGSCTGFCSCMFSIQIQNISVYAYDIAHIFSPFVHTVREICLPFFFCSNHQMMHIAVTIFIFRFYLLAYI